MTSAAVADPRRVTDPAWDERLAALTSLTDAAVGDDVDRCVDGDLAGLVVGMETAIRQLQAVQARAVADAARRGLPARMGAKDGAGWLRSLTNVAPSQASMRAQVGETVLAPPLPGRELDPDLAPVRAAVLSGAVTLEHAQIIVEVADRLSPPAVPADALAAGVRAQALSVLAEHSAALNVYQLRTAARRLVLQVDPKGDDRLARDEDRQFAMRGLTLSRMSSGVVHLTGTLTSDCAGLLATAIDAGSAPRPDADGAPDDRTAAMRRHDSLQALCRQVVAADGVLPSTHGAAYRLVVTVPHATLQGAIIGEPGGSPATLPDGWPLSRVTAATLVCTAELTPVSVDASGNPLDVGDTQYLFPPRIRTAIIARDQHCTWRGCAAPASWCDTHHLRPFSAGGPTAVTNGTLLCGRHHRHVHAHGLVGELRGGRVHWSEPPSSGAPPPAGTTVVHRLIDHLALRQQRARPPEMQ